MTIYVNWTDEVILNEEEKFAYIQNLTEAIENDEMLYKTWEADTDISAYDDAAKAWRTKAYETALVTFSQWFDEYDK